MENMKIKIRNRGSFLEVQQQTQKKKKVVKKYYQIYSARKFHRTGVSIPEDLPVNAKSNRLSQKVYSKPHYCEISKLERSKIRLPMRYKDRLSRYESARCWITQQHCILEDSRATSSKLCGTMSSNPDFQTFSSCQLKGSDQNILDVLRIFEKRLPTQLFFGS